MPSNGLMISLTSTSHSLFRLLAVFSLVAFITSCARIRRAPDIEESSLKVVALSPRSSLTSTSQATLHELSISDALLSDPKKLEAFLGEQTAPNELRNSLLLSETYRLYADANRSNSPEHSLASFIRAAHFAYQGFFSPQCGAAEGRECLDIRIAYNRAVAGIILITDNAKEVDVRIDSRYRLDSKEAPSSVALDHWQLSSPNNIVTRSQDTGLGASSSGCVVLPPADENNFVPARICSPITFLITFDERTDASSVEVHISAYDTLEYPTVTLHGREVRLNSAAIGAWSALFAEEGMAQTPVSCFGAPDERLPTALFLVSQSPTPLEWTAVAHRVVSDPSLYEHFNFCAFNRFNLLSSEVPIQQILLGMRPLAGTESLLTPFIFISQGKENDAIVTSIKNNFRDRQRSAAGAPNAGITIAGALSIPSFGDNPISVPNTRDDAPLSRTGTLAVGDIKKLLAKLSDSEEGAFGNISRRVPSGSEALSISPVM